MDFPLSPSITRGKFTTCHSFVAWGKIRGGRFVAREPSVTQREWLLPWGPMVVKNPYITNDWNWGTTAFHGSFWRELASRRPFLFSMGSCWLILFFALSMSCVGVQMSMMSKGSRSWCWKETLPTVQRVRPQDEKLKQQLLKYTACHRGHGLRWLDIGTCFLWWIFR